MKTNTWIKRSANNVMWTLFCSFFFFFCLIHTLWRFFFFFYSISSEWKTKIDFKNKTKKGKFTSVVFECLHKAACTVRCEWMFVRWEDAWELVITAEEFPPHVSFQFSILFCCFFFFACQILYSDVNCY